MAARYLKPGLNCLVIDAGTCLTYDYLGFDGFYGGGGISMGMLILISRIYWRNIRKAESFILRFGGWMGLIFLRDNFLC